MMMTDQTKKDRQYEIIDAAYHVIAEKGFEGLRIREVADRVGINNATLHYYFATKDKLIQAVVRTLITDIHNSIPANGFADLTPVEYLQNYLLAHIQYSRNHPHKMNVLSEIVLRAMRQGDASAIIAEIEDEWYTTLNGILVAGIEEGYFSANINADATTSILINMLRGIAFVPIADDAASTKQIIQQIQHWLHRP